MKNNKRKTILTSIASIIILLVIVLVISFAYLSPNLGTSATTNVDINSCGYFSFIDGSSSINLTNSYPMSDNIGKKTTPFSFSVKNTCVTSSNFTMYLVVPKTSEISEEFISYEFNSGAKSGVLSHLLKTPLKGNLKTQLESMFSYEIDSVYELTYDSLTQGQTKYYDLKLWINQNGNNSLMNKTFTLTIAVIDSNDEDDTYADMSFARKILENNGGKRAIDLKSPPDFGTTTGDGVYAAEDDYGTSYYFRGAVNNNWVKFGKENGSDIYWRIIRINGDGSVRMIYSGITAPTSDTATTMTTGTEIGTAAYHTAWDKAEYQGYTWTVGERRGTGPSGLKTAVDAWYKNQTNLEDNEHLLADAYFCNDRTFEYDTTTSNWNSNLVGVGLPKSTEYNMGRVRLDSNKTPTLKCPNKLDAYTKVDTTYGNALLTHPVGLITADEVSMAGGVWNTNNSSYYLYTNSYYWTLSPYIVSAWYAHAFFVRLTGNLNNVSVDNSIGSRPAVSLAPNSYVTGSGTYDDIYVIE